MKSTECSPQYTDPVHTPPLLPQPQHISHTVHPSPLLHHPMCSPHSPTCKRLPAMALVPYLDTLTIPKEQHSMVPNHIAAPDSMNTDLITPWRKPLPPSTSLITCAALTAVPLGASFFLLWWASMISTSNSLLLKVTLLGGRK